MISGANFAAYGPGLIALQSAVTLFFVHRRLSRVRHALMWALAFAALAIQWLLFAASDLGAHSPVLVLASVAAGLIGLMLLAEGFHMRASGRWPSPTRIGIGIAVLILMLASRLLPASPWTGTIVPLIAAVLFCLAARQVVRPGQRASIAERVVIVMLLALAGIKLLLLALGPLGADPALRATVAAATWMPTVAASGLFTLLLIASDFSVELRRLLHTDPLTGLLNRAGFEEQARGALARARTRPVTLAVADIDLFKGVNDRFGHAAGDTALACVADHLRGVLGRDDVIGRIGGEEFAILLWGSDGAGAVSRIELVRAALPDACMEDHPDIRITASFGLAERARGGESLAALTERADHALYRSKREGRDRTTLAEAAA